MSTFDCRSNPLVSIRLVRITIHCCSGAMQAFLRLTIRMRELGPSFFLTKEGVIFFSFFRTLARKAALSVVNSSVAVDGRNVPLFRSSRANRNRTRHWMLPTLCKYPVCYPVVTYPWIFRTQTIRTQAQTFRTQFRAVHTHPSGRFEPNKL